MKDLPCCPLCHKDMNSNEVADLTIELNDKIDLLPEDIVAAENKLKSENNKLEKLLGLQSHVAQLDQLRTKKQPKLKADVTDVETRLITTKDELTKFERDIVDPKGKIDIISSIIGDMSILDDALKDIERSERELEALKSKLSDDNPSDLNIETLQTQCAAKRDTLKGLKDEMKGKKTRLDESEQKMRQVLDTETHARNEEYRLKGLLQDFEAIKNRGRELEEKIVEVGTSKDKARDSLHPIKLKLDQLKNSLNATKEANARKMQAFRKQFDDIKRVFDDMERVSNELKKMAQMNLPTEIERVNRLLEEIRTEKKNQVHTPMRLRFYFFHQFSIKMPSSNLINFSFEERAHRCYRKGIEPVEQSHRRSCK